MAGFSEQRQQLRNALVTAGLSPDAASQIASILGNSAQEMRHDAAVRVDTTPADLRMVDGKKRKLRFPNLDFRDGDPDHRNKRTEPSEEKKEKKPEPNVLQIIAPQQTPSLFHLAPGVLTDVAGQGDSAQVNVRAVVAARPPAGMPIAMMDSQANQLVGKALRAQVGQNDGTARLDVQETGQEVLLNLQMLNRSDYDVVTKVEYVEGKGLEVTYDRIKAWNQGGERTDTIPVTEQPVIENIVNDADGLRGVRRIIPAFSSRGYSNAYFNVYRIGTFTGGWAIGDTKTITQVWPTSANTVDVVNETQAIADTPSTKYVLYAARTEDAVAAGDTTDAPLPDVTDPPAFDANGELVDTDADGAREPVAAYYAIEIQNAQECTAFNSLNGIRVDELVGFDPAVPSALSYSTSDEAETPCLMWRPIAGAITPATLTVLTGVALTAYGLEFTTADVDVLSVGSTGSILIPIAECVEYPPPEPPPE